MMNLTLRNTEFNFSYYNNLYSAKEPPGELDINQLIEIIRYGYLKEAIENLRSSQTKEAYNKIKQAQIPCVTLSGIFTERNSNKLVQHSGLIQIDLDNVENYSETFNKLTKDFYTYVCFKSPGGKGIKVVVKINPDALTHLEQYYALEKHYLDAYALKIDSACKDVARCLLLSYDPDIFCNPFSEVFAECLMPETIEQKNFIHQGNFSIEINSHDKKEIIDEITHNIVSNKIDLSDSYEKWIKIGYALSAEFGEAGREYFHKLSQFHPGYKPSQCDRQYSSLQKRNNGAIGIGTLIFLAKEKGITFKLPAKKPDTIPSEPTAVKEFNPAGRSLFELLKEKRYRIATEKKIPAYAIFYDRTLLEMEAKLPATQEEFECISGVGLKNSEKYAQHFLPIIRKYKGVEGVLKLSFDNRFQEQKSQTYKFTDNEQVLYESLRQLRLRLSQEERVKPYWIFGNTTLNEIVQLKPGTAKQLLGINNIGQKKVDWFGQEILDLVKQNN